MNEERTYRALAGSGLEAHTMTVGETDLAIYLSPGLWTDALARDLQNHIIEQRRDLQSFITELPDFAASHIPLRLGADAPPVARKMAEAAVTAGVGPMAAVAGFFAESAAAFLAARGAKEVIVVNGGDIYICGKTTRNIGIFAGAENPFSGKLAIELAAALLPCAICTSSGTLGSSFSYGRADAAVVIAGSGALADAAATATANAVQSPADVAKACDQAMAVPGVAAAVVICGDQLAAAGEIALVPLG